MGSAVADPESLLQQLQQVVKNPDQFRSHGPELTTLARRVASLLESPFEKIQRLAHSGTPLATARIGQEHGIFRTLVDNSERRAGTPTTTGELSSRTGLKNPVLETLLEYMATQDYVDRVSAEEYRPTKISEMLLTPIFTGGITHFHDSCIPPLLAWNRFLNGEGQARTAFELGQHTPEGFYQWMEAHPVRQRAFHNFIKLQFASLPTWLDVIDFRAQFALDATVNTPVFVDVGGGNGQQCVTLLERHPELQGRVILQDLKSIIATAITGDRVESMEYDFLTEQPIKNARAYYFRQIFHNHDHEACLRILRSHVSAMGASSVLLIDEKVIPEEESLRSEYITALGVHMLAMFNALERRETQWESLLAEAGLKVRSIQRFSQFGDSIIVAVKA